MDLRLSREVEVPGCQEVEMTDMRLSIGRKWLDREEDVRQ